MMKITLIILAALASNASSQWGWEKARVDWSKEVLKKYDRGASKHVYDIATGDGAWIYAYEPESGGFGDPFFGGGWGDPFFGGGFGLGFGGGFGDPFFGGGFGDPFFGGGFGDPFGGGFGFGW